jgi:hypothetical protein
MVEHAREEPKFDVCDPLLHDQWEMALQVYAVAYLTALGATL